MTSFGRSVARTGGLLAAVVALERAHPSHRIGAVPEPVGQFVRDLAWHGLNEEDDLQLLAGYYEDLLTSGRETTRRDDREQEWRELIRIDPSHERVEGFLHYRMRAGLDFVSSGGERVVTNRFGMVDREYELVRPAGVRRIAWVGDSLTRGLGAPFGRALEPRFEEWLGSELAADAGGGAGAPARVEVLNFGAEGYRITQMVEVVARVLPPFQPDVVLVGLSDLSVTRTFASHLAACVHDGIAIPHPFLRELAARAGVRADDPPRIAESKLATLRREIVRACLADMRDRAAALGAGFVVMLLPAAGDPGRIERRFGEARAILAELRLPVIDLLSTFAGVDDLDAVRVSRVDHHPNEEGYGLLLARLQEALRSDPELFERIAGRRPRAGG